MLVGVSPYLDDEGVGKGHFHVMCEVLGLLVDADMGDEKNSADVLADHRCERHRLSWIHGDPLEAFVPFSIDL